ncbi:MAG: inorganic phosphate transporter family protein [Bacteroidetes bacterium]|nr:inorganic phosphate transporter family protein [Bacteroidota bacterium]
MSLLVVIIILALVFDYINGFHDAANSIATIVSTKVLTPLQAVIWASAFNFTAFFLFKDHAVANTISKTVADSYITLPVIFSGLVAAIFWNLLTWWYGIPSSSSHTLIGGFAGAALTHALMTKGWVAFSSVVEMEKIIKTVLFIFLAPLIGMVISMFITIVTIQKKFILKSAVIFIAAAGTWFMFEHFKQRKMEENLSKFLRVEKYKQAYAKNPSDESLKLKLEKANSDYQASVVYLPQYPFIGAKGVADSIAGKISFADLELGKLKDGISKTIKLDLLKKQAFYDNSLKNKCDSIDNVITSLNAVLSDYHLVHRDTTIHRVAAAMHLSRLQEVRLAKFLKVNLQHDLAEEIIKADNSFLQYGVLALVFVFWVYYLVVEKLSTPSTYRMAAMFKKLQLVSSAAFSIGHGGNDAQKVMGIIGAALIANGDISDFSEMGNWVPLACYTAIGLGTLSGGWKIVKTMGTKITKVTPLEGVSAETAGAMTLFMTEQMGIPVSTTHTITGSIIGVGATKRLSAVRWGVTRSLLWAWILTIPVSAIMAGIVYLISRIYLA